jgi:hypothetical protein
VSNQFGIYCRDEKPDANSLVGALVPKKKHYTQWLHLTSAAKREYKAQTRARVCDAKSSLGTT